MKKKLDTTSLVNELREQSVFFREAQKEPHTPEQNEPERQESPTIPYPAKKKRGDDPSSNLSRKQDSLQASNHASMLAGSDDIIETIRKVVRMPAKEEVLYVRVTREERQQLRDIEYTYQRQPIETSANELGRIAVNFLIADYQVNGKNSILAKVLEALHA